MQSTLSTRMIVMTLFIALAVTVRLAAQVEQGHNQHAKYRVFDLGTLGGTSSGAIGVNNLGWVTGFSNLPGDETIHATLWLYGFKFDLGTLGGPNSAVNWPVKSDHGQIVGIAETSIPDPLGEVWSCRFFTGKTCQGFLWQNNLMAPLPPLPGGNNSYAAGVNNRGQVVGWAENAVHDPTCVSPQVLQFEAVIWEPKKGRIQQLPPLPGDPDGAATAINDRGQVVGISGICDIAYGGLSAAHAVLWQSGTVTDLGNFGGAKFNTAAAINNQGQVVGWSDLPGDTVFHAFLWTKGGGIQDLGTLPGDVYSLAYGINNQGQVVGQSLDADFNSRAFLWQNGVMTDLNSLVPPGSLFLIYANDINAFGEIVGGACDQCAGEALAFSAIPRHDRDGNDSASSAAQADANSRKVTLPESMRKQLQQRRAFGRLGLGPITGQ